MFLEKSVDEAVRMWTEVTNIKNGNSTSISVCLGENEEKRSEKLE